jgi:hypothetical protein
MIIDKRIFTKELYGLVARKLRGLMLERGEL